MHEIRQQNTKKIRYRLGLCPKPRWGLPFPIPPEMAPLSQIPGYATGCTDCHEEENVGGNWSEKLAEKETLY